MDCWFGECGMMCERSNMADSVLVFKRLIVCYVDAQRR